MKAIRVHAPGGVDALRYEDVPDPSPGEHEVLVAVEAAGVNFIDVYHRTGLYPLPLPIALGREGAGRVLEVGRNVSDFKPGDLVAWEGVSGSYAERVVVPAKRLIALDGLSPRQGAAIMLQGLTAHYLACSTVPLHPGDVCLVHASAGGVGLLLVQIAKLRGATVIGRQAHTKRQRWQRTPAPITSSCTPNRTSLLLRMSLQRFAVPDVP